MQQTTPNTSTTILTIIVGLLIVFMFVESNILLWVAIAIGALSVFSKWIRDLIHTLWMKLADILGLIVPKVVLGVIFFLIVTPLGIISRWLSPKEQLQLKNDKHHLFITSDKKFDKPFFEKPW